MLDMFFYNWQVREDWFKWCDSISVEELKVKRVGGMGSILNTLIHIIDCELLWVNYMLKHPINYTNKDFISNLEDVIKFSDFTQKITETFLQSMPVDYEEREIEIQSKNGTAFSFTYGKIVRHMISHEIHHIGQLSIWSRGIGIKPISSDLIIRNYNNNKSSFK